MATNTLDIARKEKNDEFYTQLQDIEAELILYKEQFQGKIVLCNCDDPEYSNFWKYFQLKFYEFGLKKLIATHYEENSISYKMEIIASANETNNIEDGTIPAFIKTSLTGDGDFRSKECTLLLEEADIVVTNPPFSLFREYVSQLIRYNKKFLIIGNQAALTYKEIFPLIKNNKMWLGYKSGSQVFRVPNSFERKNTFVDQDGVKYAKFGNICWFTNLDVAKRHVKLSLFRRYADLKYVKFDNYDAINVDKIVDIPCDYTGIMGVPITFISSYNPEQFEIIGLAAGNIKGLSGMESKTGKDGPYIDGKLKFGRIFIKAMEGVKDNGN